MYRNQVDAALGGRYTPRVTATATKTATAKAPQDLLGTLRRYWGYESFRPLQEKIVNSLLGGHDTCVVMPTGGGKSLCYQLPAVVLASQTVIVVSPLIALMQDQVAQLSQMGIPAALLNSTLSEKQQQGIIRNAERGKYRLLYLSPERLARRDTLDWLVGVPVSLFAIDEAHCISEWGHEFRPEYRKLSGLRSRFPNCPIAAFTASATQHVRHDIIEQLKLRDSHNYIASFHRPNLRYIVKQCQGKNSDSGTQNELLLKALRRHCNQSVIVYSPTIRKVGEIVNFLQEEGIAALPYHGKMDAATRRANQEKWMADEARVLVGTIAFGLGINKASVRAVIHLSLPKSIEQYYQEAGRAGRDGLPSDCILLWQTQDEILLRYFINQIQDSAEKGRAQQRSHAIRAFVISRVCRHLQICKHFGEGRKWKSCDACDVCGCGLEWLEKPVESHPKMTAEATPMKDRQRRSQNFPKTEAEPFWIDSEMFEKLREWRRGVAKNQGVGAFVIMHDTTLEEICRKQPSSLANLREVCGIGQKKLEMYGSKILKVLEEVRNSRESDAQTSPARREAFGDAEKETARLLNQGHTFEDVARIRDRKIGTVISMAADLVESGELAFRPEWLDSAKQAKIAARCLDLGLERLRPIKDSLPDDFTYYEIRLVVAKLRWQQKSN
ncbi:MAG TPA: RecQ family ATP-dependent DNA helicase [Candidatus Acidoferrum sp.]|nr:RecQ family ATP-dependent DNA helicase [Candidatus Acidoferrum sp.]